MAIYLLSDCGCFADGAFGHDHIRAVLAKELTKSYKYHPHGGEGLHWRVVRHIVDALEINPDDNDNDDSWEEGEALKWLNKQCEEGCSFMFLDGDLVLIADAERE